MVNDDPDPETTEDVAAVVDQAAHGNKVAAKVQRSNGSTGVRSKTSNKVG
jgi:hypothetical protein